MADETNTNEEESASRLVGRNPVILLSNLSPGGAERQGYLLAKGLTAAGWRPGVIAWTLTDDDLYRGLIENMGVPLAVAPQNRGIIAKVRWLRRVVKRVRPPVLHSYALFLNAAAAWAMRGIDGIAVGSIRSDYSHDAASGALQYAVNRRWPKTIIANSVRARDAARADRSLFRPRTALFVPNGLDAAAYRRRAHCLTESPRVLGVGNLYPGKRWDHLIEVVGRLQAEDSRLQFTLGIVGEGGERDRLSRLISDLGLSHRVSLLGRRYDVPDLLQNADVFVSVSDAEGMPNAVLEAMASGLPVLATDVGDIPQLVENGVHGYLVPVMDDAALADRLRALVRDHELRARMGAAAFTRSHTRFGIDALVENTLGAYRQAGARL